MNADPLTIAYIAIGAHQAIRESPNGMLPYDVCDKYEGQMNFIEEIIAPARLLDRIADEIASKGAMNYVFLYEVAEPFGYQYAQALIRGEEVNLRALITKIFNASTTESI